jgi:hypothetical protein
MAAETLDSADLLANTYEPKRKFRWIMGIDGLDAFVLKTAARPQGVFDETVVDWINTKRFLAGKFTWSPIQITMHDPIVQSAAQKLMTWVRRNYEPLTGRMGYAEGPGASDEPVGYKQTVTLKLLDPQGTVAELWELRGAWPQDVNFGDLDMASSDNVEISFTLRFDNAIHQF